jgi:hypothetical protein
LDDRTYKRGKLLAKSQTVSLSALLRLLINGAFEQVSGDCTTAGWQSILLITQRQWGLTTDCPVPTF